VKAAVSASAIAIGLSESLQSAIGRKVSALSAEAPWPYEMVPILRDMISERTKAALQAV
jgi:hypothetical protein